MRTGDQALPTWAQPTCCRRRVLLEPGLHDRLAAGAEAHAQQFGWDRTAASMLTVYARAQEKMRADVSGLAL